MLPGPKNTIREVPQCAGLRSNIAVASAFEGLDPSRNSPPLGLQAVLACIFVNLVAPANGFLKSTDLELECWRVWPQRTERSLRLNEAHSGRFKEMTPSCGRAPTSTASETTRLVHGKFSFSRFVPKYCPILTMAVRALLFQPDQALESGPAQRGR